MNRVILMGRLTRDPEVRYSQGERSMAIARYTLAVDRRGRRNQDNGEQSADFINCVIWRQQAENLANWAKKGALIGITGRIQTRNYENQQGQRVYVTEVVADSFQLLESRAAREGHAGGGYSSGNGGFAGNATPSFGGSEPSNAAPNFGREENPFGANPMDISDDDLPF